ncbi:MAG: hypothetical protein QW369_04485 [Desulfurococcaceae archaeon]
MEASGVVKNYCFIAHIVLVEEKKLTYVIAGILTMPVKKVLERITAGPK